MADGKELPKLSEIAKNYMRLVEEQNKSRVADLLKIRRRNRISGALLGAVVLGIYSYTLVSIKQEKFLDDFEEPKLVEKST